MQQHHGTLDELGIRVVVVTFAPAPVVRAYIAETTVAWPILIDEDRALYRAYGMHRGRIRDIWGARTWLAYLKEFARGRRPRYVGGDTRQLGGDVLIDPEGIIHLHWVGSGPADRPSLGAICEARRRAR